MRLLVLGGTEFVGTVVVADALGRGWDVTVLNRGSHPAPAGVTVLRGDRTAPGGLAALAGAPGDWDIAVDTWSWAPAAVRDVAAMLADRVGLFGYVSSRSVYAFPGVPAAAEDAPLVDGDPDESEDGGLGAYNRMKRGGELAALAAFGEKRTLLARPGLILGPGENLGRLPWWLNRVARGGRVLAPGPAGAAVRFIDARDLAGWLLDAAAAGVAGAYDTVCPPGHATMGELLAACVTVTGSDAQLVWTDPEPILAAGVRPWTGLPMWLPPGEMYDYINTVDVTRALDAGLRVRPAVDTAADTWAWLRGLDGTAPLRPDRPAVGIDPAVEAALLAGPAG